MLFFSTPDFKSHKILSNSVPEPEPVQVPVQVPVQNTKHAF